MFESFCRPRSLFVALAPLLVSGHAAAWIETSVISDAVTVQLESNGQATVSHDLWMKIRGGALKGTQLDGVDSDAEPLADAQVVRVTSTGGTDQAKSLLLSRGDDDTLQIEVDDSVGLRNGTYSFRFSYRTDLRQKSRIALRGSWAEVVWIGPRYPAGLDVAKVTFRIPHHAIGPRLPEIDPTVDGVVQGELPTAALLSTLRRGAELDELELVRPHIAKGEPVLWRSWASPQIFPWFAETSRRQATAAALPVDSPRSPLGKGSPFVLAFLLAAIVAGCVAVKHRAVLAAAAQQQCMQRPLVALSTYVRAALSGMLTGMALLLSVRFDAPTFGAVALLAALLLMTYRKPELSRQLRGPGRWLPLHKNEAFLFEPMAASGRFLDASTVHGKAVLGAVLLVALSSGAWLFRTQPYLAIITMSAAAIPWPLLLTGRTADLPGAMRNRDRRALEKIYRRLCRIPSLRIHPIGRIPDGESCPDEIRLKITGANPEHTITGLEVAAIGNQNPGALCLLIRYAEGNESTARCEDAKSFSRGRNADERVIAFLPSVVAQNRILAKVTELLLPAHAAPTGNGRLQSTSKSNRSSGNGSAMSKPVKTASPDHATRAA